MRVVVHERRPARLAPKLEAPVYAREGCESGRCLSRRDADSASGEERGGAVQQIVDAGDAQ